MAAALGVNELFILGAAILVALVARRARAAGRDFARSSSASLWLALQAGTGAATSAGVHAALWPLFGVFLKIGSVLFGSGYVLLVFLRADFVERLHWLTERQLLDAVAVGQVTPGPVFTTATFIGYVLHGATGAAVATVGIFLPAFVFVALSGYFLPRMRGSPAVRTALDAVNAASLALMAVVTVQLARAALVDWTTLLLAGAATLLLVRWRVNSVWLVLGGGALGMALHALQQ